MDQDEETSAQGGGVASPSDDWLDVAEQQEHARRRARVAIPTKQSDFSEVWEESPRPKGRKNVRAA